MSCRAWFRVGLFVSVALLARQAQAVNVPTNQGTGQDGFAYSNPGAPFPVSGFYNVIPVGATVGQAHDTESLVQFDLSALGLTAPQVTSASLTLWLDDTAQTGFGFNPDATNPVPVGLYPALGAWSRSTLTWAIKPATGPEISQIVVNSINHSISFDITNQVKAWLLDPASNFGLLLRADAVVGGPGNYHYATFDSGFGTASAHAPFLTVVPEPSSWALALIAAAGLASAQRRRLPKR